MEGLILAQGERWRHASYMQVERSDAGSLLPALRSGERVSNTWATCLEDGDNSGKLGLIPDMLVGSHGPIEEMVLPLREGPAAYQLVGGVTAYQGNDG